MAEKNYCYNCEHRDQLCDLCGFSEKGKEMKEQIKKNLVKHFA